MREHGPHDSVTSLLAAEPLAGSQGGPAAMPVTVGEQHQGSACLPAACQAQAARSRRGLWRCRG